jgi:phosphohistidine phosphatase
MELLVIRHGIATERDAEAGEAADAERPLTSRGRRRFKRVVRGLDRLGLLIDQVVSSPKRRAVETAELLRPILALDNPVRLSAHLTAPPGADLLAELSSFESTRVAVVGHEPFLGSLIALLTASSAQHGEAVELKKGGVCWLEGVPAPGAMRVRAHMPPRVLRRIR